jgi:hypothetical protein
VWRQADRPTLTSLAERVNSIQPSIDSAITESTLFDKWVWPVYRCMQICRVEERQSNASHMGSINKRATHGIGVVVGRPVALMVYVVELANTGYASQCHLSKHRGRQLAIRVRRQPISKEIHGVAPLPKVTRPTVSATAQSAVKGMTVRIDQTRNHHPSDTLNIRLRLYARCN